VASSDHAASLTIASWHRWDREGFAIGRSVHIYQRRSAWNYMGEARAPAGMWMRPMTRFEPMTATTASVQWPACPRCGTAMMAVLH